jgi:hypothetical protein
MCRRFRIASRCTAHDESSAFGHVRQGRNAGCPQTSRVAGIGAGGNGRVTSLSFLASATGSAARSPALPRPFVRLRIRDLTVAEAAEVKAPVLILVHARKLPGEPRAASQWHETRAPPCRGARPGLAPPNAPLLLTAVAAWLGLAWDEFSLQLGVPRTFLCIFLNKILK